MQTARTASQGHAPSAPPSIEEVRRRARHRLIGAAVLVLLGVIGFSLLFDTQPRSLPVDIPIVIPSKGSAPAAAKAPAASAAVAEKPVAEKPATAPAAPVAASESLGPREEVVSALPAPKPESRPEPKPAAKPATPPEAKPEVKPAAKPSDADRARALLEGKTEASTQRIVVQVGALPTWPVPAKRV